MKKWKKTLITFLAIAAAFGCLLLPDTTAKAVPYDKMFDANGLFLGISRENHDKIYVDANGQLQLEGSHVEYLNKLRLVKEAGSDYYPTGDLYLAQDSSKTEGAAQIVSVKSNNKNLKCIISYQKSQTLTFSFPDDPSAKPVSSTGSDTAVISVLAKKAGTYTVTATVKLKDGRLVNTSAIVKVDKKSPISVEPDYKKGSGIDGTFNAKSLKVKVNKSKSVKNMSCYYSNTLYGSKTLNKTSGTYTYNFNTYKKFKSGKKIKLNAKASATYTNSDTTYTRKYTSNYWYAPTHILVIYTDTFYGTNEYSTTTLSKYRKLAK